MVKCNKCGKYDHRVLYCQGNSNKGNENIKIIRITENPASMENLTTVEEEVTGGFIAGKIKGKRKILTSKPLCGSQIMWRIPKRQQGRIY